MRIGANNTLAGDHRQKNIREIRIFALYLAALVLSDQDRVQDKCVIRDWGLHPVLKRAEGEVWYNTPPSNRVQEV